MSTAETTLPEVFCTVGTDHHPFARFVEWLDRWLAAGGASRAHCFVQHGTAPAPRLAAGASLIPYPEMQERMHRARLIVCHGAGATIMEARRAGKVPIVLPRMARNGEHVDDHQLIFSRRLAAEGTIVFPETPDALGAVLDDALRGIGPAAGAPSDEATGVSETVRRFEELVTELMVGAAGRARTVRT